MHYLTYLHLCYNTINLYLPIEDCGASYERISHRHVLQRTRIIHVLRSLVLLRLEVAILAIAAAVVAVAEKNSS